MKRFKEYAQNQVQLLPASLEELIGPNDLVRVVNEVIGGISTEGIKERFSRLGCPAYHPEMMLKVLVYAYCMRMYSVRQISRALRRDVVFMWLSGMQKPDYRTLNRFRGEYFKGVIDKVFAEVVLVLIERGYVKGEDYFVDGTKIAANAGRHTVVWSKKVRRYKGQVEAKIKEILAEVERLNEAEDKEYGGEDLPEYQGDGKLSPEDIKKAAQAINERLQGAKAKGDAPKERALSKAGKELAKLGERFEKYEAQERTLGTRNSYSKTDEDASFLRMKDGQLRAGYNVQIGTESGFVVGYSVHQNANDGVTFKKHLEHRDAMGLENPKRIIADSAYGTEENYQELAERKIENFLKYPRYLSDVKRTRGIFEKESFDYDRDSNCFVCPAGARLTFREPTTFKSSTGFISHLKKYSATQCGECGLKPMCCRGLGNRSIWINDKLSVYQATARANLSSEEGQRLRKRRGNEVESAFADLKFNQKFSRFSLRGLLKVTAEAGLNWIAFNIRKLSALLQAPVHA